MANSLSQRLKGLDGKIRSIVDSTIKEFAQKILDEATAQLPASLSGDYRLEKTETGYSIWTTNELIAYLEFGTGQYAAAYLAGKPTEMTSEAIKFYVNGDGTMRAHPHLFPAYYKYRDMIVPEIDKRVQQLFDRL